MECALLYDVDGLPTLLNYVGDYFSMQLFLNIVGERLTTMTNQEVGVNHVSEPRSSIIIMQLQRMHTGLLYLQSVVQV